MNGRVDEITELVATVTAAIDRNIDDLTTLMLFSETLVGMGYTLLGILIRETRMSDPQKQAMVAAMHQHGSAQCDHAIAEHSSTLYRSQLTGSGTFS